MGQEGFLKNSRVYILTSVAYMGSLLFGMFSRYDQSKAKLICPSYRI